MTPLPPGFESSPKILFDETAIATRIRELGAGIADKHRGSDLTVVSISNGATIFAADLVRAMDIPIRLDSLSARSYDGAESVGEVDFTPHLKLDPEGCRILLLDDILDTGRTLRKVVEYLRDAGAESVETCVMLDKPARRVVEIESDHVGFEIQNVFVVGYGLDYNEYFRNLPYIGTLPAIEPAD
jgi:hypoxanthine phosphoribosyltransferase